MKRLIDADSLSAKIEELADIALRFNAKICIGDVRSLIADQPTIVCVSDDFPTCPKVIRCENIMFGGTECGGDTNA